MTYRLGNASLKELEGVHPSLVAVVKRAIMLTTQDFSVHDGLRTMAEQQKLVAAGASKTMNSMHRTQPDGFGYAADLVPYINGKLRWEWPAIYPIATAVRIAAQELGVDIRWGGNWGSLNAIPADPAAMKRAVDAYTLARKKMGKSAFLDGPHYELAR